MGMLEGFIWGVLGGFIAEFLGLYKLRRGLPSNVPTYLRSWLYWIIAVIMVLLGGVFVVGYVRSGHDLSPAIAIHLGLVSPLVFERFAGSVTEAPSLGSVD